MDNQTQVSLKLTSPSLSYEAKISDALAVQIMAACVSGNSVVPSPTTIRTGSVPGGESLIKESVAEYIIRVGARRNPDKILAFASYLLNQQQKQSVSPAELKLMFRDAGEPLPANFTRDFNDTTVSGWLAPEPQKKGYYYVTRTGLDIVDKGFEKAALKRLKKTSSKKPASEGE